MGLNIGLSQSACASWVQAWGSIGAIMAAISIPAFVERRAKRQRYLDAIALARTFATGLGGALHHVMPNENVNTLSVARASIDSLIKLGHSIPLYALPPAQHAATNALQAIAVQAEDFIRQVVEAEVLDWDRYREMISYMSAGVDEHAAALTPGIGS
jgi:hypothetical protein